MNSKQPHSGVASECGLQLWLCRGDHGHVPCLLHSRAASTDPARSASNHCQSWRPACQSKWALSCSYWMIDPVASDTLRVLRLTDRSVCCHVSLINRTASAGCSDTMWWPQSD